MKQKEDKIFLEKKIWLWVVTVLYYQPCISKLLDAFSTKSKKGDTTVDDESHMSKMKS